MDFRARIVVVNTPEDHHQPSTTLEAYGDDHQTQNSATVQQDSNISTNEHPKGGNGTPKKSLAAQDRSQQSAKNNGSLVRNVKDEQQPRAKRAECDKELSRHKAHISNVTNSEYGREITVSPISRIKGFSQW